jgi:hypothetical protein
MRVLIMRVLIMRVLIMRVLVMRVPVMNAAVMGMSLCLCVRDGTRDIGHLGSANPGRMRVLT